MPSGVTPEDIEELLVITEQRKRGGKKSTGLTQKPGDVT
jgi:hypothetical protein